MSIRYSKKKKRRLVISMKVYEYENIEAPIIPPKPKPTCTQGCQGIALGQFESDEIEDHHVETGLRSSLSQVYELGKISCLF